MFRGKQYIYEIYKTGSFSAAAKNLYISQPALSNSVHRIEERIGKLEAENETIDGAFLDPETASDPEKLLALSRRKAELEQELEEAYEKWEALQ